MIYKGYSLVHDRDSKFKPILSVTSNDGRVLNSCMYTSADIFYFLFQQTQQVDTLGPFDRKTQSPIPNELYKRTEGTADAKGDGVVQGLLEAIVVKKDARRSVHVRMRVLGLMSRNR